MNGYSVTSESVTEGHPDKLCDQISDALLDAYLSRDGSSRVALETMVSSGVVMVAGEVTSQARVDVESVVRGVIRDVGYVEDAVGMGCSSCLLLTNIHAQSSDIARGVDGEDIGAGDQGIMYGYACNETKNLMPLPIDLAHRLARRLAELRKSGGFDWLRPDGKTQVTVRYDSRHKPLCIEGVIVSAQHSEEIGTEELCAALLEGAILPVVGDLPFAGDARIHVNPTGRFVLGGPSADTGVTGRKLMVDTYGGVGRHGGGAFSGKDPTKVDRSAAYMCRYAAKNLVSNGLADRCEVSVAYAIGRPEPEAFGVNTFGTGRESEEVLARIVAKFFPFSVRGIIERLSLRNVRYRDTAAYGHFGREDGNFTWERTDAMG